MIDSVGLYPVTVLEGLTTAELSVLAQQGLMLCRDLAQQEIDELVERLGFPRERLEELVRLASEIIAQPVATSA